MTGFGRFWAATVMAAVTATCLAAEPTVYAWVEAEEPVSPVQGFSAEAFGKSALLSGGRWYRQSLDKEQAAGGVPEGGFVLWVELPDEHDGVEVQRQAASRGIETRYVSRLLSEFERMAGPSPSYQQPLIEPLSERELEVLRLVAAGKSNQDIAAQLFLSTGTVKSHLNHIFGKLNVESRTQCVARARELKLLKYE